MKNEIILFENQDVKLEVNIKDETVWLTQKQMAELFGKDRKTITSHIKNIYRDNELNKNEVCSFFEHTASDGKKYKTQYYNLDMIISVGYRVNSKQGIIFRKWATSVLKEYLINGYAVNKKRLEYLEKTVKLIDIASRINTELKGNESREIIRTIYNTFDGKDLYSTIEEKASNFLYLIIKNHIFIDGNKRITATLFIYFLNYYNILYVEYFILV